MMSVSSSKNCLDYNSLIEANAELVKIIVGGYRNRRDVCLLDFEDMVSIGNIVLCECVRRYDPEKAQFNTFLTASITRKLDLEEKKQRVIKSHTVEIPEEDYVTFLENVQKDVEEDVCKIVETKHSRQYMAEKLSSMFPYNLDYEKLFALCEQGCSQRMIAALSGCSQNTVYSAVKRIRKLSRVKPSFFKDSYLEFAAQEKNQDAQLKQNNLM